MSDQDPNKNRTAEVQNLKMGRDRDGGSRNTSSSRTVSLPPRSTLASDRSSRRLSAGPRTRPSSHVDPSSPGPFDGPPSTSVPSPSVGSGTSTVASSEPVTTVADNRTTIQPAQAQQPERASQPTTAPQASPDAVAHAEADDDAKADDDGDDAKPDDEDNWEDVEDDNDDSAPPQAPQASGPPHPTSTAQQPPPNLVAVAAALAIGESSSTTTTTAGSSNQQRPSQSMRCRLRQTSNEDSPLFSSDSSPGSEQGSLGASAVFSEPLGVGESGRVTPDTPRN